MLIPIEKFEPELIEPFDYDNALPNFTNAYICACISELCYKGSVVTKKTDEEYKEAVCTQLEEWGWSTEDASKTIVLNSGKIPYETKKDLISGTQGLIIFYKDIVFVGFRGSELKLNDWRTNFSFNKVESPYLIGKPKQEDKHKKKSKLKKVLVHNGFSSAFDALIPKNDKAKNEFDSFMKKIKQSRYIWLTGHSLGGALASIAASYLLSSDTSVSGIYTFGAPRVGGAAYRDEMNRRLTYRYWRFINENDLVADIPQTTFLDFPAKFLPIGYSREGCILNLTKQGPQVLRRVYKDGSRKVLKHFHGRKVEDHGLDTYKNYLLKLAETERNWQK